MDKITVNSKNFQKPKRRLVLSFSILIFILVSLVILVNKFSLKQILNSFANQEGSQSGEYLDGEIDVFGRTFLLQKNNRVIILDSAKQIKNFSLEEATEATSIALDQSFNFARNKKEVEIVVLDSGKKQIKKYSIEGKLLSSFFSENVVSITTDVMGFVYGIDSQGLLMKWDQFGNLSAKSELIFAGNKIKANGLTADWQGNIYILSDNGYVFSQNGKKKDSGLKKTSSVSIGKGRLSVDFFGNLSISAKERYLQVEKNAGVVLGQGSLAKNNIIVTQRFGSIKKDVVKLTPSELGTKIDQHYRQNVSPDALSQISKEEIERMKKTRVDFEKLLSDKPAETLLISKQDRGLLASKVESKTLKFNSLENLQKARPCLKPNIYKTEAEIPERFRYNWPNITYPGMSSRIYVSPEWGNTYGRQTNQTDGVYSIRLGIETDKWDIFAAQGVCPPLWVKENILDPMNNLLENAVDAAGIPVRTRMVLLSYETYDKDYFADFFGGWISYVPPWFPQVNRYTGKDINWLLRQPGYEAPDEDWLQWLIYGLNQPWIAGIDAPCGLTDIVCIWAVIHETGHAMDLSDLYGWDLYDFENQHNRLSHWSIWDNDVMHGYVFNFTPYTASNLNRIYNARTSGVYDNRLYWNDTSAGVFFRSFVPQEKEYAFVFHALPRIIKFQLTDQDGNILSDAKVNIIPSNRRCMRQPAIDSCDPRFDNNHSQFFKDDYLEARAFVQAEANLSTQQAQRTNEQGIITLDSYLLTRRDQNSYFDTGIDPWRAIHSLILAEKGEKRYNKIVEITELNTAYVQGNTEVATIPVQMAPDQYSYQ